jgi:hypothetical protein
MIEEIFHMLEIDNWAANVLQCWNTEGIDIEGPASSSAISEVESILGFKFPDDFKCLYQKVNGFKDREMNKAMFSIWSLERIVEEHSKSDDKNFVGFCDYLISCHFIGFYKNEEGIFKEYDQFKRITLRFSESIDLINQDSELLH